MLCKSMSNQPTNRIFFHQNFHKKLKILVHEINAKRKNRPSVRRVEFDREIDGN